jgi:hypothetical protein
MQQIAAGLNQPLGIDSGVQTQILLIAECYCNRFSCFRVDKGCES